MSAGKTLIIFLFFLFFHSTIYAQKGFRIDISVPFFPVKLIIKKGKVKPFEWGLGFKNPFLNFDFIEEVYQRNTQIEYYTKYIYTEKEYLLVFENHRTGYNKIYKVTSDLKLNVIAVGGSTIFKFDGKENIFRIDISNTQYVYFQVAGEENVKYAMIGSKKELKRKGIINCFLGKCHLSKNYIPNINDFHEIATSEINPDIMLDINVNETDNYQHKLKYDVNIYPERPKYTYSVTNDGIINVKSFNSFWRYYNYVIIRTD